MEKTKNPLKAMSSSIANKAQEVSDKFIDLSAVDDLDIRMDDVDAAFDSLQELGGMAQQFGKRIAYMTGQPIKLRVNE